MNASKAPTNKLALLKGKAISTSTPSFSIRYNAEDEEVEQLYDIPKIGEAHSDNSSPQTTPTVEKKSKDSLHLSKVSKRSGSLEEPGSGEPWRLFTEIRGRITKTVEEKIEEMNRLKEIKKQKKKAKLKNHPSLSDSEDRSEPSLLESSSPEKSGSEKPKEDTADSDLGDVSEIEVSLGSDKATTPLAEEPFVLDPSKETPSSSPNLKRRALFKSRQKSRIHRRKKSHGKVEVAVDALQEVEQQGGPKRPMIPSPSMTSLTPYHKQLIVNKKKMGTFIIMFLFSTTAMVTYLYRIPPFIIGMIVGAMSCLLIILWTDYLYDWICGTHPEFFYLHGHYKYQNFPFLSDKMVSFNSEKPEERLYTGWMNEFTNEYQPETYHITDTESVYVSLVGCSLKLSKPRNKIPKRAMWNEAKHKLLFDWERSYDISNCTVKLLPEGLIQKRIWSKKYPICINLLPHSHIGTKFKEALNTATDSASSAKPSSSGFRKEIILGERMKKKRKWIHHFLKKKGKDEKIKDIHPDMVIMDVDDSDIFLSDLDVKDSDENETTTSRKDEDKEKEPDSQSSLASDSADTLTSAGPGCEDDDEEDDDISKEFVQIPSSLVNKNNLYLFARTDREKDLWYRRLKAAVGYKTNNEDVDENIKETELKLKSDRDKRDASQEEYIQYMKRVGKMKVLYEDVQGMVSFDYSDESDRQNFTWLNLFISRMLFDTMKDSYWVGLLKHKIQRKLSVIKVPNFMEKFSLSNIEFHTSVPMLERCQIPKLNDDGLWIELDISYQGMCKMTIDTKINLMRMKVMASKDAEEIALSQTFEKQAKSAYFDSSQEDSAETSCEEDYVSDHPNKHKPNKALLVIDKIAASKMFQHVTDNKLVKKAMENVSNTTISLYVEVKSLIGTVVLNIPPPPTDRLWYGFKPNTKLHLSAKPRVGDHGINMGYITGIIEKKLYKEFQKLLVIPNMDDLVIPVMTKEKPY